MIAASLANHYHAFRAFSRMLGTYASLAAGLFCPKGQQKRQTMNEDDIERAIAKLAAKHEALQLLLILSLARMAGSANTITSMLNDIPTSDQIIGASNSVPVADLLELVC